LGIFGVWENKGTRKMKIKTAIVRKEISTDKDLEIYQNTTFKKNIRCRNIICIGEKCKLKHGEENE
jgi:bifunctional N-acetylglucosamine-1-phosphate-uridyltransferase/glucosamine-1-phosphate-acetyltransferase GlmU-like protein